jgi:predicted transcriptional regulator
MAGRSFTFRPELDLPALLPPRPLTQEPRRPNVDTLAEIRRRRLALGISLGELARAIGRSDATLSRIERGQIRPSYDLVQKVLAYLEAQEGLTAPRLTVGDLMHRPLVTVESSATLATAAQRMEGGAYSQLPVVDEGRVVGALSESALLRALAQPNAHRVRVRDVLERAYPVLDEAFPGDLLPPILGRYPAILVARRGVLEGIVTKADLIRGLRGASLRRNASA